MNPDPPACLPDTGSDLDEFDPQGVDLGTLELCAFQMFSHQEKQTVGKDMEVEAKLIREKPVTAQPVGFKFEFQLLDPVLDIPPKHVDIVVDPFGFETKIRHHKPLVGAFLSVLGLGNDPAGAAPRLSPIPEGLKEPLLRPGFGEPILGSSK